MIMPRVLLSNRTCAVPGFATPKRRFKIGFTVLLVSKLLRLGDPRGMHKSMDEGPFYHSCK